MGSNSSYSSKSGNKLDYYGKWESRSYCGCSEEEKKVEHVEWKSVPMSSTSERVALGIGRGVLDTLTFGLAEIGFRGQRYTHDVIEVKVYCPDHGTQWYTLEWVNKDLLEPGYYSCYSPVDGVANYSPSNMTLSNLRSIMNQYGTGNCKDRAKTWWSKIKYLY